MNRISCALLFLLSVGCAGSPQSVPDSARAATASAPAHGKAGESASKPPGTVTRPKMPTPAELVPEVERAKQIGRILYVLDQAAWHGTDRFRDEVQSVGAIPHNGYVAVPTKVGGVDVYFIREDGDQLRSAAVVGFQENTPTRFIRHDPPQALSTAVESMYRARRVALEAPFPRYSKTYNTVVIPASLLGKPGWAVYLLGGTEVPKEMVFTGVRIVVAEDLKTLSEVTPLTRSDLRLNINTPANQPVTYLYVTHLISEAPIETHVFASLLHKQDILVLTSRGMWMVVEDDIGYYGPMKRDPPAAAP